MILNSNTPLYRVCSGNKFHMPRQILVIQFEFFPSDIVKDNLNLTSLEEVYTHTETKQRENMKKEKKGR